MKGLHKNTHIALLLALILISFLIFRRVISNFDYDWQWERMINYLCFTKEDGSLAPGIIFIGLLNTLKISMAGIFFGSFIGIISGIVTASSFYSLRWFFSIYVEIIRGTPLLVQMFIVYFVFGSVFGVESSFACGVIALSLFSGAYLSETIRAGILAIPKGQWYAAQSLGFNKRQILFYIILPQAFKIIIAPYANVFISLIKDSSLVSVMAILDLTKAGRETVASTFMVFEVWILIAFLYFCMTSIISLIAKSIEGKLKNL